MRTMRRYAAASFLLLCPLAAQETVDMQARIDLYAADLGDLRRRFDAPMSAERDQALRTRLEAEAAALAQLDFDRLDHSGRVDWLLLDNHVRRELQRLDEERRRDQELAELLPFAPIVAGFVEAWRRHDEVEGRAAAGGLDTIREQATQVKQALAAGKFATLAAALPERARSRLDAQRRALRRWFEFRDGYDPQFSWWTRTPFQAAEEALGSLHEALGNLPTAAGADRTLIGDPIGEAALRRALELEWIPYSPQELVAIAEREFAWCDAEMAKATQEMGLADWRAALEQVKQHHRQPGEQPALIRALNQEAIDFLRQHDLLTIPPLAEQCWRMSMMSREAQRVNPFFLGGDTIQVSFPTEAMTEAEKLQSLRSNNEHFCRATVFHELIPGHWLQQYSQARYRRYREPFDSPFWIEGWALYWEMRMYELGFAKSPEDRIGALYWRKHRCARIVFSLNFHLGRWTGPQCVDYLIERVGHERAAAEGEVRRSVSGGYGPLYQAAYMLGGLQFRALHDELVGSGRSERQFHDAVLRENAMPVAALRAALRPELPGKTLAEWRFADR